MFSPSIFPYFALMGLYLAVSHCVVRSSRFYDGITSTGMRNRYESLDGLRGILALGVFFHHAVITQGLYVTGQWSLPPGFYGMLGPTSVAFFFMITGFLFWSKAIQRRGRINALALWRNRIRRIAPMCLFTVFVMLAAAAVQSHFRLCVPLGKLAKQVIGCLSLGLLLPDVNGQSLESMNASVFWTLRYEWSFYFALPLLAWLFATPKKLAVLCLLAVSAGAIARLEGVWSGEWYTFFLLGMIAAQLVTVDRWKRLFGSIAWPLLGIALLIVLAASVPSAYANKALMFVVFLAIACDSGLVSFLRWQAARVLGTISYSIYLIHAIVIYFVFRGVNQFVSVAELSPQGFWLLACGCGLTTVLVSAVTYRFVEHPFLSSMQSAAGVNPRISTDSGPALVAAGSQRDFQS